MRARLPVRQRHLNDQIAARGEGAVDRLRKVAGRDEQEVRVRLGQGVELHQHGVGGAVNIDRVGFEAHLRAVGGERLDLIEQHDGRACGRRLGDRLGEEVGHRALGLAPSPNW